MYDVIEGMAIAFSLFLIFGVIASFIVFTWVIGRKEREIFEEYENNKGAENE